MKLRLLIALCAIGFVAYGQKKQATFEDGSTIDYEIKDVDGSKMSRLYLNLGSMNGLDFFYPNLFQASLNAGIGYEANALVHLIQFTDDDNVQIALKSEYHSDYKKIFTTKEEIKKQYYFGPVIGYSSLPFTVGVEDEETPIKTAYVGVGITRWRRIVTNVKNRDNYSGSYYTVSLAAAFVNKGVKTETTTDESGNTIYPDPKKENKVGILLDYKTGSYPAKHFGMALDLGVVTLFGSKTQFIPKFGFCLSIPLWTVQ